MKPRTNQLRLVGWHVRCLVFEHVITVRVVYPGWMLTKDPRNQRSVIGVFDHAIPAVSKCVMGEMDAFKNPR
jgi:hypothetical protein